MPINPHRNSLPWFADIAVIRLAIFSVVSAIVVGEAVASPDKHKALTPRLDRFSRIETSIAAIRILLGNWIVSFWGYVEYNELRLVSTKHAESWAGAVAMNGRARLVVVPGGRSTRWLLTYYTLNRRIPWLYVYNYTTLKIIMRAPGTWNPKKGTAPPSLDLKKTISLLIIPVCEPQYVRRPTFGLDTRPGDPTFANILFKTDITRTYVIQCLDPCRRLWN